MRHMSFSLTTAQMRARTKDVTRRYGWTFLKVGDVVLAVVKSMGLRKGEKVETLYPIEILDVQREPLSAITMHPLDVVREGFPHLTSAQFVAMLCKHSGKSPDELVTRIVFQEFINQKESRS